MKLYYIVQSNGDGSSSPTFFKSYEDAEKAQDWFEENQPEYADMDGVRVLETTNIDFADPDKLISDYA